MEPHKTAVTAVPQESFTYDVSFLRWMVLHHDGRVQSFIPCGPARKLWSPKPDPGTVQDTLHSLVMWRAIRHQFIFGAARGKSHSHISCPRRFGRQKEAVPDAFSYKNPLLVV